MNVSVGFSPPADGATDAASLGAADPGSADEPVPVLTMSLEMARLYLNFEGEQELDLSRTDEFMLGPLRIPYPNGRMLIRFYGPPATFPRMSFWRAVKGELDPNEIRGKIVLIGPSTPTLHDFYCTPPAEGGDDAQARRRRAGSQGARCIDGRV